MRTIFNLDKEWRFRIGDEEAIIKTHGDSYTTSKAGHLRGVPAIDYDDSEWRVVNVPHDYFSETEFAPENLHSHGYKTRGNAWYRKTFKLPAECEGKHLMLSFEGMAVQAEFI